MGGAGWKRSVRGGIAAALAAVVALGASSAAGADGGGGRDLKVMTQNLYLGSSLTPALDAQNLDQLIMGVAQIYATVTATNFPVRAAAIADEVDAERPGLIGLQEVSNWCVRRPATGAACDPAASYDFLDILQRELDKRHLPYAVAAESDNALVPPAPLPGIPLLAPQKGCINVAAPPAPSDCVVSFQDRDVILVNLDAGIALSNPMHDNFEAQQSLPVVGLGELNFNRGWASVDGVFQGDRFRFVTTHLEVETFPAVQEDQARELVAGPLATKRPVILVGDLNSTPDGIPTKSYQIVLRALFADAWWTNFGKLKGFTCCQAERLDNPTSQLTTRIDYVLVRLALPTSARLVNDDRIPNRTAPPLWASDHAGIVATVHLF